MSLLIDVAVAAESIVQAAWNRAAANRERLRRRLDVQAVREEVNLNTINGRKIEWEQKYTTPTPVQYRPDEPAAYPVSAAGTAFGFALIPNAAIDTSIEGPFGDFMVDGWPFGFISGGIRGLAKGYTNKLWGLRAAWGAPLGESRYPGGNPLPTGDYSQCIIIDYPQHPFNPPTSGGGGYTPSLSTYRLDACGSFPGVNDLHSVDTKGGFVLSHIIANGPDLKYKSNGERYSENERYVQFPSEAPIALTRPAVTAGLTLECIVRLGAGPSTFSNGYSNLFINIDTLNADGFVENRETRSISVALRLGNEAITLQLNADGIESYDLIGGNDIHVAVVATPTWQASYLNGQRRIYREDESGGFALLAGTGPMICRVELEDRSAQWFEDNGFGGWNPLPPSPEFTREHNGPSIFKGIRYTQRVLYSGESFTPPSSITRLA